MKLVVFLSESFERTKPKKIKIVKDYGPAFDTNGVQITPGKMVLVKGSEKEFEEWARRSGGYLMVRAKDSYKPDVKLAKGVERFVKLKLKQK